MTQKVPPLSLHPQILGDDAKWWSYSGVLLNGIEVKESDKQESHCRLFYPPTMVAELKELQNLHFVVEYENDTDEQNDVIFSFKLYYGTSNVENLSIVESDVFKNENEGRKRLTLQLNKNNLRKNSLTRFTLEVHRKSKHGMLIYGTWLEVN